MLVLVRGRRGLRLGIAVVTALVVLAVPGAAFAQVQTVTANVFTDEVPSANITPASCTPDHCTLREAVEPFAPDRVVQLLPGRYELGQTAPLRVWGAKTINGAGATIDANELSRAVVIVEGANAVINDVTITGGNADTGQSTPQSGGGISIEVASLLSLNRSTVTGNHAGANGGGIFNGSNNRVVIADSTISANTAGALGAGIYSASGSNLSIVNSTISGNQIVGARNGNGAGIAVIGSVELVHVTIAGNTPNGTATAGSSLAIAATQNQFETAAIWNSVVVADDGAACLMQRATTGDHNLDDDGTCGFSKVGDRPGVVNALVGPLQDNGGPTNTNALLTGSPAIDAADSPHCRAADQRGGARPQLGGCDMGAFEYFPPPPGTPPPPPPEDGPLPPPVAGKSVNVLVKSGTVRIKLPGRKRFRRLPEGEQVPVGTTIDTLNGRVTLVAAADKKGGTATSDFYGGIFKLSQTKGSKPITTLKLVEKLSCAKASRATIAARRKKKRRLWGDGKGRFRTEGSYSSATVRGTKWLVEDRCTNTLTRVVRGRVAVRDKGKRKTVIVRAGRRYVAKARS